MAGDVRSNISEKLGQFSRFPPEKTGIDAICSSLRGAYTKVENLKVVYLSQETSSLKVDNMTTERQRFRVRGNPVGGGWRRTRHIPRIKRGCRDLILESFSSPFLREELAELF
ncbi:hypothetical protein NPIL_286891 [Nephila pilipes]|uniref:Uncharacterized protein n=1 Tax=Nephila pilipes TaxID=299642 RepID=A0A8X6NFK9_NEPPI|nr:hypothetical protein NPIL_286891 [Nephila pilipes]